MYSNKSGYPFAIPAGVLVDYQGLIKNDHEIFLEIYPQMPPVENGIPGREMVAVFSLFVQALGNRLPEIRVHMENVVKWDLWGVVPVKNSAVLP